MKNIAGIDPTDTKRSATPRAPFDRSVASWTLGSTDAHAPQNSPSVVNPSRVVDLRGSAVLVPGGVGLPERPPGIPPVAPRCELGLEPPSLGADVTSLILREAA